MTQPGQKRLYGSLVQMLSAVVLLAGVVLSPQARFAHAAGGDLDPAFDRDGRRVFVSSSEDRGLAVAIQPNGKIVVAGDTDFFGTLDVLVMRFNRNGSADSTFDNDGRRIYDEPGAEDHGQAVAVQANDGKIVVAGYSNLFGRNNALLLRFNADGRLDPTFDNDGRRIVDSGVEDRIQAVAIQRDGKIVVAGYSNELGADDILVMRFNANGSLDSSFHNDGRVIINGPGNDRAQAIALHEPGGKIVVAGYIGATGNNDFRIVRLNANGSLDSQFAGNGQTSIRGFGGDDRALAVALQPIGQEKKIVVAGYTNVLDANDFAVARLNANGALDSSFNGSGRLIISDRGDNRVQAVAVQADAVDEKDRKIVLAGYTNASGNNDFALVRLNTDGNLDGTFGINGRVVTRGFGGDDRAFAAAISPIGGKIVAAGYTTGLGTKDVAVACYLPE